jgi:protein-tyrosine phosphatase
LTPDESNAGTDFHSHLVPGVDDGSRTLEDALDSIERLRAAGIERIVTTPHLDGSLTFNAEMFDEVMEIMDGGWERLSTAVAAAHPGLDLRRGHEVKLDHPNIDFSDARMRLGGGPFILVEWARFHVPPGTGEVIQRIVAAGYRPIIAHPERYYGLDPELRITEEWRRRGARLQVNHGSLVGQYGDSARTIAFRLLRRGWVDYLSTDFHGRPKLELHLEDARDALLGEEGEEQWSMLTATNPSRLLREEDPLPVPPLPLDRGFWGRLRRLFGRTG